MANFVIRKDQTNNVYLTLRERSQLIDPFYLIVFEQKFATTPTYKYVSVQNQASYNVRYDLLQIIEQANPNALDGEVRLMVGEWSYKVYESTTPTLEISETTERIIQQGLIIVTDGDI